MTLKPLLVLPLIFLGAAASPPADCGQTPAGLHEPRADEISPSVRSDAGSDAGASRVYSSLPQQEVPDSCGAVLPYVGSSASLRNDTEDVMHGLPNSDALAPITQMPRAPLIK